MSSRNGRQTKTPALLTSTSIGPSSASALAHAFLGAPAGASRPPGSRAPGRQPRGRAARSRRARRRSGTRARPARPPRRSGSRSNGRSRGRRRSRAPSGPGTSFAHLSELFEEIGGEEARRVPAREGRARQQRHVAFLGGRPVDPHAVNGQREEVAVRIARADAAAARPGPGRRR